mgnify:CR=1 FL=1
MKDRGAVMSELEYIEIYKDERFAIEAFKEFRMRKGIVCKKCGYTHHYWLESKRQFQCKACKFRTTLRSGTVLEGSKLPITYFFIAIHLLIKYGNELTTEKFQEVAEHKHFDAMWDFLRRVKDYVKQNENTLIMLDFLEVVNYYHLKELRSK